MKELIVNDFKLQQFLSAPMYLDKNYILSLPDIPISANLQDRLLKWNYKIVYSDGSFVANAQEIPASHVASNSLIDSLDADDEVILKYKKAMIFLISIYESIRVRNVLDRNKILTFIKTFRDDIVENLHEFILVPHIETEDFSISQSVRTAIIATAIGDMLKIPVYKQLELVAAAFLHKIGMVKIPRQIYLSDRKLTPEEIVIIKKYPMIGAKIVKESGFPVDIIQAIMEHQESYDGSGYPQKLKGDNISIFARIINVASAYCAATSKRPFKEKEKAGHTGILEILKGSSQKYDPRVSKCLIMMLSIYPLGTFVITEQRNIGVVVKTNSDAPKYPEIQLLCDLNYMPLNKNLIVKTDQPGFRIVKILPEEDIIKVKTVMKNWTDKLKKRLNN